MDKTCSQNNCINCLSIGRGINLVFKSMFIFLIKAAKEMPRRVRGICSPKANASLTLEASIVLPIFTCFLVAILFFFRVTECQLSVEKAMDYGARMGASITTDSSMSAAGKSTATALAFARTSSDKNASSYAFWPTAAIVPVADGDNLTLTGTSLMKLPLPLIGTKYLVVNQRVTARQWVGYTGNAGSTDNADDIIVYVTEGSDVYHMTTSCTHICLSVSEISGGALPQARTSGGGKFKPCEKCHPSASADTLYIAKEGDKYHSTMGCSGLKRTYYTRFLSEVQGVLRPCSRCGQ